MDDGEAAAIVQELTLAIAECLDELDGSHEFFLPAAPSRSRTFSARRLAG
jgi:hypothetical protein